MNWLKIIFGMKCKVCNAPIKSVQYTGIGEYEEVCIDCGKEIAKSKLPQMRKQYENAAERGLIDNELQ